MLLPESRKCAKTRRKTLKKLATENGKVSSWLVNKSVAREDVLLEVDDVVEMEIEI